MNLALVKGSNVALETGFCCLCRRPDETDQDKRQQTRLGNRILLPLPEILAFVDPKKGYRTKCDNLKINIYFVADGLPKITGSP